jgi:hypothetical protein
VALTIIDISGLLSVYLELNQIGSEGCKYLSKAKWPNLTHLYLSHNNIISEGVKWICKSNWSKLQLLCIGTFVIFRFQPDWE